MPRLLRIAAFLTIGLLAAHSHAQAHPAEAHAFRLVQFPKPLAAPAFEAATPDQRTLRLADFRGRFVLLNFWATWCVPCLQEMPSLERLQRRLGPERLTVLAVSQDDDGAVQVTPLVRKLTLTFPIALDPEQRVAARYGVGVLPSTFLIDPQGRVLAAANGAREWDSAEALEYFTELTGQLASR
jgi:peroxiredoxin